MLTPFANYEKYMDSMSVSPSHLKLDLTALVKYEVPRIFPQSSGSPVLSMP